MKIWNGTAKRVPGSTIRHILILQNHLHIKRVIMSHTPWISISKLKRILLDFRRCQGFRSSALRRESPSPSSYFLGRITQLVDSPLFPSILQYFPSSHINLPQRMTSSQYWISLVWNGNVVFDYILFYIYIYIYKFNMYIMYIYTHLLGDTVGIYT